MRSLSDGRTLRAGRAAAPAEPAATHDDGEVSEMPPGAAGAMGMVGSPPPLPTTPPPSGFGGDEGEQQQGAAHGTPRARIRMTTSQELAFLGPWPQWATFIRALEAEKKADVGWRNVLSHHTTTSCQPGKREGPVTSLGSSGLSAPTRGGAGRWRVSVRLGNMFRPGDNIETEYTSPNDHGSAKDAKQVACLDILALSLVSGPRMVKLCPNNWTRGDESVETIRTLAEELQTQYATYHSFQVSQRLSGPGPDSNEVTTWPTWDFVQQEDAPREESLPTAPRNGVSYKTLRDGETQESRDVIVLKLLGEHLKQGEWYEASRLPPPVWRGLAELVVPGNLVEFLLRHKHVIEVARDPSWFRMVPPQQEQEAPPAPGSVVGAQPLGSWFAHRCHNGIFYGKSCGIRREQRSLELEYVDRTRGNVSWQDLVCLAPFPREREPDVGEEMCAWWDGRCQTVTYVSATCYGQFDGRIIVRYNGDQFRMRQDRVWVFGIEERQ